MWLGLQPECGLITRRHILFDTLIGESKMFKSELVNIHHNKPFTSSLIIAEQFGKRHDHVTDKIKISLRHSSDEIREFSLLNFRERDSLDSRGKPQAIYEITEDGFLDLGMSFTGEKAKLVRIRFIAEFRKAISEIHRLQKLLADPDRKVAIQYKRNTHKYLQDVKKAVMERDGLPITNGEFIKENFFCNRALTGEWKAIDENNLDAYDLELLGKIREHDALLICRHGKKQEVRKQLLDSFVSDYRSKHPKQCQLEGPKAQYRLN